MEKRVEIDDILEDGWPVVLTAEVSIDVRTDIEIF